MSEHSTLTGAQLHEPKGVASASAKQVYVADGLGSGVWKSDLDLTSLKISGVDVGGGMKLLNTLTASNSASLSDTTSFTSTYKFYKIVFENLVPTVSEVYFKFLPRISGVFQTSVYVTGNFSEISGSGGFGASDATFTVAVDNDAGAGLSGFLEISNPTNTSNYKIFNGVHSALDDFSSGSRLSSRTTSHVYLGSQAACTGFQVLTTSGNISTGNIYIFGWN